MRSGQVSPLTVWAVRVHEGRFSRDPLQVFSAGGYREQFRQGRECPLFDVRPAFPLLTAALPIFHGAMKDGFVKAVVTSDRPEPYEFSSLDSCRCQKRFLRARKEDGLAPHPLVGLQGDAERFSRKFGLESQDPFLEVSKQGPCLAAIVEDGDNKRLSCTT